MVELSAEFLMALNIFRCEVCNKGFERAQNLELHRRGHSITWKLNRTSKVYMCPEPTCVHHRLSRAFNDFAAIKDHYSRMHADKGLKFPNRATSGGRRKLMMISGSFYISKDRKSRLQGEDAHFICAKRQAIGVADGVGGNTRQGIDAGIYATRLMINARTAMSNEPHDKVDPSRVLAKAWSATKALGSSTACILSLQNNRLRAVNMGDSGFMFIRKGELIYKSPIQQHSFNCPYQLANDQRETNNPKNAQAFDIAMKPGDIVITGTDGLFDNLFEAQIEAVARKGVEQGLDPEVVAWMVAEHAYRTSLDGNAFTPFTQASAMAGRSHRGGKRDDITVIVSYIIES